MNRNKFRKLKDNSSGASTSYHPTAAELQQHSITTDPFPFTRLTTMGVPTTTKIDDDDCPPPANNNTLSVRPQPAPRLSLSTKNYANVNHTNGQSGGVRVDPSDSLDVTLAPTSATSNIYNNINLKTELMTSTPFHHHQDGLSETSSSGGGVVGGGGGCEIDPTTTTKGDESEDDENDSGHRAPPPPLPPKPKILPIKPSNWGQSTVTTMTTSSSPSSLSDVFKVPKEMPRRLIQSSPTVVVDLKAADDQRNVYLDQTSSSFV